MNDFELLIITGLSGSGMTEATKSFEDVGFLVMDNLPPSVIDQVTELCRGSGIKRAAVVVRPAGGEFFHEFFGELGQSFSRLRDRGVDYRIIFLEASDEALVRRYEEKRRPHPLAVGERVQDGIARERQLLEVLRDDAEVVIDTSALTPHQLRDQLLQAIPSASSEGQLHVSVLAFGFKYGLPIEADLVFDARFLPNPHWVEELRPLPGTDQRVRDYVLAAEASTTYLAKIRDLLAFLVPAFAEEGKHYLTVAIGCTGGHHRSVVLATEVARYLEDLGYPTVARYRDLERE